MEIHHGKHHAGYVTKLNAALEGTTLSQTPITDILSDIEQVPEDKRQAVINNGGGHANHSLFWQILSPQTTNPSQSLSAAIQEAFGSFDKFKEVFSAAALTRFGSGWAWLVVKNKALQVMSTPNQDSPLMQDATPILGIDVWEHAYYLSYQNRRPDYIAAFFSIIHWERVSEFFEQAL